MPRRGYVPKREILPDVRYGSIKVARFINKVMQRGKKSTAERIVYRTLELVGEQAKKDPLEVFEEALKNSTPLLAVRPRRIGGATYQVPVEVPPHRQTSLAIRWILGAARNRSGRSMAEKLAAELMDAVNKTGAAIKKREDTHRMAEANQAFAHYRW